MLKLKDFEPEFIERGILGRAKFETLKSVLARANDWIDQTGADIVNVETVAIPVPSGKCDPQDTFLRQDVASVQVVRVWYQE